MGYAVQETINIGWWQLASFMLILVVPLIINWRFELKLASTAGIAVTRMVVQLVLVGLYLEYLFKINNVYVNVLWLLCMLFIGTSAIITSAKLPRKLLYVPVLIGLLAGLAPLLAVLLLALLQPSPIYSAQYLIPLAGMLLGNSLSGNIVALQRLFGAFRDQQDQYEGALALGATPHQACFSFVQQALRQSLAPVLASMATTGLVTLPGMMTGQILGGVDPMLAIKYQLVILVAIFVMLSVSIAVTLALASRFTLTDSGRVLAKIAH